MKKSNSNKKINKWLVFTSMPFQMGVTIYLFHWVGTWLDERYQAQGEWWMKGMTLLGVAVSLFQFIKQVNYLNKHE